MKKYIIGIDIGGTNVKMGLVDGEGRIILRSSLKTKFYIQRKSGLISALIENIKILIRNNELSAKSISGVAFGLPGLIDPVKGIVKFLPNIPGWKNVHLAEFVKRKLRVPVFIENDVNLIALAEWKYGAGLGARNMICITLGTGVGGGLILDNRLYRGEGYAAGEIGHVPLTEKGPACNCGGWGCLESYVGNRHLQKKAAVIFKDKHITLETVGALAQKGDTRALRFWHETAVHIGNTLTGIANVLNPTRIVIGGGVANSSRFMFKTIEETIKSRAMKVQGAMVKVVKAKLGDDAGIIGAQVLITDSVKMYKRR